MPPIVARELVATSGPNPSRGARYAFNSFSTTPAPARTSAPIFRPEMVWL